MLRRRYTDRDLEDCRVSRVRQPSLKSMLIEVVENDVIGMLRPHYVEGAGRSSLALHSYAKFSIGEQYSGRGARPLVPRWHRPLCCTFDQSLLSCCQDLCGKLKLFFW